MSALIDIANHLGCGLSELKTKLSPDELELRLVHQMNKSGYTYDQQKIKQAKKEKQNAEAKAFLANCPWNKGKTGNKRSA